MSEGSSEIIVPEFGARTIEFSDDNSYSTMKEFRHVAAVDAGGGSQRDRGQGHRGGSPDR
ncbi:hypothetical protein NCTC2275_01074 [Mycobacterium marinum]|nr:hypothetical protein NCTC2275_01074 [Mycobacterium marinum]